MSDAGQSQTVVAEQRLHIEGVWGVDKKDIRRVKNEDGVAGVEGVLQLGYK